MTGSGVLVTYPPDKWTSNSVAMYAAQGMSNEVIAVEVRNVGRMPAQFRRSRLTWGTASASTSSRLTHLCRSGSRQEAPRNGGSTQLTYGAKVYIAVAETLAEMLEESAMELLRASLPHVRQALEEAEKREEEALDDAGAAMQAAISSFERAAAAVDRRLAHSAVLQFGQCSEAVTTMGRTFYPSQRTSPDLSEPETSRNGASDLSGHAP